MRATGGQGKLLSPFFHRVLIDRCFFFSRKHARELTALLYDGSSTLPPPQHMDWGGKWCEQYCEVR